MEIHYGFLLFVIAILILLWYCVLLTGGIAHERNAESTIRQLL